MRLVRSAGWPTVVLATALACGPRPSANIQAPDHSVEPSSANEAEDDLVQRVRAQICACRDEHCVSSVLDQHGAELTAREPLPEATLEAIDSCVRDVKELHAPLGELESLAHRMCACTSDDCRHEVAKDAQRAAVVNQRFSGITSQDRYRELKDQLDGCFGEVLFE